MVIICNFLLKKNASPTKHMQNFIGKTMIEVYTREEANVSYEQIVELMHDSFQERLGQGLHFTCSAMTVDEYKEKTKGGTIVVAIDTETKELLGTAMVRIHEDADGIKYGYHEYLAVSPKAKRLGVGTLLLEKRIIIIIINAGGQYVMSDTACGAQSSVNWHLKNGFLIYELKSYKSTNYFSYVFVKPLNNSVRKFSRNRVRLHYCMSFIMTKTFCKEDGSYTTFGKLVRRFR